MEANELRIGNYVKADGYYPYADIDGVEKEAVRVGTDSFTYDAIEPIPLTEEWLLKFGFINNPPFFSREYNLSHNESNILMVNHYEDGWLFRCDWWRVGKMIKYVHQLQNLFFALTGEEFTIK